jgi:predicted small lipoprotein YifL
MRVTLALAMVAMLAACGDKVPQSKASTEVGNIPKQTRDRAVENTTKALQQGADRNAEADKKQ